MLITCHMLVKEGSLWQYFQACFLLLVGADVCTLAFEAEDEVGGEAVAGKGPAIESVNYEGRFVKGPKPTRPEELPGHFGTLGSRLDSVIRLYCLGALWRDCWRNSWEVLAVLGAAKPAPEHLATKEMFDPTTFVPREKAATKKFIQIQCFHRNFVDGCVSLADRLTIDHKDRY